MTCASCGRANRDGARFCDDCGASLAARCPSCGAECRPGAKFCDGCGTPVAPRPAEAGVARKVVTIVFADLIGSISLQERLDPESVSRLMDRYHRAVRAPVEALGGSVVQLLGDGVMCAFGVPRVAEDDAIRAVCAGVGMQQAFRAFRDAEREVAGPVGLRVAINTGEVVVSDDYAAGIGDPLNVAARLQQEARDGDVLISASTERLVGRRVTLAPVGTFALKGRSETVAAYRVVSLERPLGAPAVPFVGREDELRRLESAYEAAVAAPAARLAVVLGSPGLGKSRLVAELARQLGDRATVLFAQCDAAGSATFAPLAEAFRAHLRIEAGAGGDSVRAALDAAATGDDAERARVAAGIGALLSGTPAPPEETFFVVRRLLAALAAERPVVLAIDDLQWAEPLLLDLTEHLVQWGAGVPLLVLAAARPELRDRRASLTSAGALVADVVTLAGLDAGAATKLAANVIGADALPAAVAERVLATSEGNPLFLGELVRMLVTEGALRREGDRWTANAEVAGLEMPPTIQALLAARIERLRAEDRLVLERAAVVGRHFSRAAVAHLLPREAQADLDARLEALRRSELIEPDVGWLLGEPVLRFHHVLIRDAAYRRVLKNTRAELHARFAEWLVERVGDSIEHDETIGWHLEQAHQHLRELGPLDAVGRELGERAARSLAAAGRRALARDDLRQAAALLGRALDRLDPANPARAELALDLCEALLASGDVAPAASALAELGRFAGESERLLGWHTCFAGQLAVLTDPQALRASADAVAAAAEALAAAGDAAGEAKAHSVHATALARLGRVGACEAALDLALAAARRARDRRRANAVLAGAPVAALWGPSPVTRASGRCLDVVRVLRITHGAPAVEAVALRCQAVLEALRGRAEAARRMIASSRKLVEELGITQRLLEADVFAGLVELLEGDPAAAERWLRAAYEGLREHGLGIDAAQAAALLARALLAQGRTAEAEALSHESEALAGDDIKAAIAWRGVRAEALARRGEAAAAVELARAAVEIAAATDALLDHADARQALAVALRAAGRTEQADAEEARAVELWEAKGAMLLVERARAAKPAVALARAPRPRPEPVRPARFVRENAATADSARLDAAVAARDAAAIERVFSELVETVHHPTGLTYDRQGAIARFLSTFGAARELVIQHETVATLGDSLALCRGRSSFDSLSEGDLDVGPVEREFVTLVEVDAKGQRRRSEIFAAEQLGNAIVRLYERYAERLADGPERNRAAVTARGVAAVLGLAGDDAAFRSILSQGLEFVDHRQLGVGSARGAAPVRRGNLVLHEVADRVTRRVDEILALRSDGLVACRTTGGIDRTGGGAFESQHLELWAFGSGGLLEHLEHFDCTDASAAVARFDELARAQPRSRGARTAERVAGRSDGDVRPSVAATSDRATAPHFANTAARAQQRFERAWAERRWDDIVTSHLPSFRLDDRRSLVGLDLRGDEFLTNLRLLFDVPESRWETEPLATRGERFVLARSRLSAGRPDAGRIEVEHLSLIETDGEGRYASLVVFDEEDLEPATVELDARYGASEAAGCRRVAESMRAFSGAFAARDWDALATLCAPDLAVHDHRLLGWEPLRGPAAYVAALRGLVELAPDARMRLDHVTMAEHGYRVVTVWEGTREGGAFEEPSLMVAELDAAGRVLRFDQYGLEAENEARVRLAAIGTTVTPDPLAGTAALRPDPLRIPPNAASGLFDRWREAFECRDWEGLEALCAPAMVYADRRPMNLVSGDRETFLANLRFLAELADRATELRPRILRTVLATAGERLALEHLHWSSGDGEAEVLQVVEVDAEGRFLALVGFDPGDRRAAAVELRERFLRSEACRDAPRSLAELTRALDDHDLERVRAVLDAAFVFHDRRRTGVGRIESVEDYLTSLAAMFEQTPDVRNDTLYYVEAARHGSLSVARTVGTLATGGAFESIYLRLQVYRDGRHVGMELFELGDLELARARFEELRPDPLRIPPNAAVRAGARFRQAFEARDWDALGALAPAALEFEDRRRAARVAGGREMFIDSTRLVASAGTRMSRTLLATAGDRLALELVHWRAADGTTFEAESLSVWEVDSEGRAVAIIGFDADDRRAASAEMFERFVRSDDARWLPAPGFWRALRNRDLEGVRTALPDGFSFHDHRRVGAGRLGPDDYVAYLAALFQRSPDAVIEPLYFVALEKHGFLAVAHNYGTLAEGGAFESVFVQVGCGSGGELYELEDLELARARLEELRPDPLRIPENAAARALNRFGACVDSRDFDGLERLLAPTLVFEDRRPLLGDAGDRDTFLRSVRLAPAAQVSAAILATAGDRLVLSRICFRIVEDSTLAAEIDTLQLHEIDAEGQIIAVVTFDASDRPAASAEMFERYVRGEGAPYVSAQAIEALRAIRARDLERLRALLPDDFDVIDHRRTGVGRVEGADAFVASFRPLFEQSVDLTIETLYDVVVDERGAVSMIRMFGTLAQGGGEFESFYARLFVYRGDRPVSMELFEPGDLAQALARFEALPRDPLLSQRPR